MERFEGTMRQGDLTGWRVSMHYAWSPDGELARAGATLHAPVHVGDARCGFSIPPRSEGWPLVRDVLANAGGEQRLRSLAEWMIETVRHAVETRDDLPTGLAAAWRKLVDLADEVRADWHARYPDGYTREFFEIVARLYYMNGELVAAD